MATRRLDSYSVLLFFLVLDGGGLDLLNFFLDLRAARRSERVGGEAGLGRGAASGFRHVRKLLEPVHVEDALQVDALVSVLLQEGRAHVLRLLAHALPRVEREVGGVLNRLASDLLVVLVIEREHSAQQQVGDDAERPVVHFFAVGLLQEHLGRHVGERAEGV
eukprot:CAMPEP_0170463072 /NCGR_PEP_ID=MMETSP0123-20130129/8323_1 /TAXON_ID=182087 /ORGANISM="Favella ehrenbergii, Strain Fehren 1" /LENGTH=162 /DNA_ID=CAMNT_0010728417 /DNA_START=355 /DNA_END=843 /DNA_ORIENTATION=-